MATAVGASWQIAAVSVTGERHVRGALANQDAHGHHAMQRATVLVVADGVSCARRPGEGAALAVGSTLALAGERLAAGPLPESAAGWEGLARDLLSDVRGRVCAAAAAVGARESEFATTLLMAVLCEAWTVLAGVGDGLAVVRRRGATMHVLMGGGPGRGPLDRTVTLTSPQALAAARVRCVRDEEIDAVLLATDGLEAAALTDAASAFARPHAGFLDRVVRHLAGGGEAAEVQELLLSHPAVTTTTSDDRTLVVALRG